MLARNRKIFDYKKGYFRMEMETFPRKKLGQLSVPLAPTRWYWFTSLITTWNIFSGRGNYILKWGILRNWIWNSSWIFYWGRNNEIIRSFNKTSKGIWKTRQFRRKRSGSFSGLLQNIFPFWLDIRKLVILTKIQNLIVVNIIQFSFI